MKKLVKLEERIKFEDTSAEEILRPPEPVTFAKILILASEQAVKIPRLKPRRKLDRRIDGNENTC
jgi:hypothetical protein